MTIPLKVDEREIEPIRSIGSFGPEQPFESFVDRARRLVAKGHMSETIQPSHVKICTEKLASLGLDPIAHLFDKSANNGTSDTAD